MESTSTWRTASWSAEVLDLEHRLYRFSARLQFLDGFDPANKIIRVRPPVERRTCR